MDQSRLKSRRLVTYGSTTRPQSSSKSATVRTNQLRSTLSRSSTNETSGNDRHRRLLGAEKAPIQSKSRISQDESIYDLPSSDEENAWRESQRKRRRYGHDTEQAPAPSHNHLSTQKKAVADGADVKDPAPAPAVTKEPRIDSAIKPVSACASQDEPRRVYSQPRERGSRQLPLPPKPVRSPQGTSTSSTTTTTSKNPIHVKTQTANKRIVTPTEPKDSLLEVLGASPRAESGSASSQTLSRNSVMPTTPNRKRLIDTLGTPERSLDASSVTGDTSQLSTPSTTHSSHRPSTAPSPIARSEIASTSQEQDPTLTASHHITSSRVTYARQRSFLDDLALSAGLSGSDDPKARALPNSQSLDLGSFLPKPRPIEVEELNQEDGSIRSIHELRRAGGNARYRGAIESIFEDIESPNMSASGRCNALIQLCGKLLDSKSARQFAECNFDKRLVESLTQGLGNVHGSLALCVFGLSCLGRPVPHVLASTALPRLLEISPDLLSLRRDLGTVARDRENNLSKATQASLQSIMDRVKTMLFPDDSALLLSPCLLALHCLSLTLSALQSKGKLLEGIPMPTLREVMDILLSEKDFMENTASRNHDGYQYLALGLSIIEAYSVLGNQSQDDERDALGALSELHSLLHVDKDSDPKRQHIQTLYLRVLLNVTNSNPTLCDKFAIPDMIDKLSAVAVAQFGHVTEDTLSQETNSLNTVILALGALINLVEKSAMSRKMFLRSTSAHISILDQLLRLFLTHVDSISQAHSVVEVHHNVAVGYLAVLLLALCLDGEARVRVKESLKPQGLGSIISTVNEFLLHHRKIEQEIQSASVKKEAGGFLVRLQDLINEVLRIDNE
ncbi:WAPL domain-containing protein [Penicillium ucsense]|uniref:WAPL domain-containing protein n=1 Tax=Penicillium ucsense TaxID=2839758 RepID=A0A8J8WKG6_9EURO|nr:WAPL domain-containing protein [Penicillium ucsense]KAF7739482.1 WAPL domain-containing protein [Penicillium ucsense]